MNMFRKKNKVKDDDFLAPLPSETGTTFKSSRAMTKKKKRNEVDADVEEKPVFNLASALPANDDFRTSLLMTSLSTRFSMLREQDDPNTKVGKASDDSVLFPKRASRLNLFNHHQLSDIAEVESIRSSFRPPFADEGRKNSISDGYGSDDGASVMNRTRPGEGNNLFGGRQKLYQIPSHSTKDLHSTSGLVTGKHTYASDVALSPFQQMRLKEKERLLESEDTLSRDSLPAEADELDAVQLSTTNFSKNRGTQSSTNSGPSNQRTSTAATSVISESPVTQNSSTAAVNKIREQDANSSVESVGFSSSPNFRKIRDESARPSFPLSQSRSAASLRDNYVKSSRTMSPPTFGAASPPPSSTSQSRESGPREDLRSGSASSRFRTASPTSPIKNDHDEAVFTNSLQPNDRGKATAMGLFNKPQRRYDEQQFQQRQLQMHEGRNSPLTNDSQSESRASPDFSRSDVQSAASSRAAANPMSQDRMYTPQLPPIPNSTASPIISSRMSQGSTGGKSFSRPRTKSSASASTREASVKARVESLIKRQNAELAALEAAQLGPTRAHTENDYSHAPSEPDSQQRTFFDNSDASDDEVDSRKQSLKSSTSRSLAPTDVHPALRIGTHDFDFETQSSRGSSYPRQSTHSSISKKGSLADQLRKSEHESVFDIEDVDSPTLGPTGLGLSGLIRTHLRQDSDKSSMMPPPSPGFASHTLTPIGSIASDARTATESIKSDPFEFDNHRTSTNGQAQQVVEKDPQPTATLSQNAQQILSVATALRKQAHQEALKPPPFEPEAPSHRRNESTETQREQQRFDEDLAERRRKIQDQLKSVQERSRSRSPVAERVNTPNTAHGFLGRLPGKNLTGDPPAPSKAMKMLGLSGQTKDPTSGTPRHPAETRALDHGRQADMSSPYGNRPPTASDGRYTPNGRPPMRAYTSNEAMEGPALPRSTIPSGRQGRNRANSAVTDRAASRNRQYPHNEFNPAMTGNFPGSPQTTSPPLRDPARRMDSPTGRRPSDRSGPATGMIRDRIGYFSPEGLLSHNGDGMTRRPSPRPSPNPTESPFQAPVSMPLSPPSSALPSPNIPATINGPMVSGLPGRATPLGARKKSVTKGMISDPTFVSSTSSVPLVHLPQNGGPPVEPVFPPPVPAMNPRRHGNPQINSEFSPHPAVRPSGNVLTPMSETSDMGFLPKTGAQLPFNGGIASSYQPRQRNRLRKSSSEGGNMAARARQQALAAEFAREKNHSPHVAVFPNRSATTLVPEDGGMF